MIAVLPSPSFMASAEEEKRGGFLLSFLCLPYAGSLVRSTFLGRAWAEGRLLEMLLAVFYLDLALVP